MVKALTILNVTDLHFHKPFFKWIVEQAEKFDVLCITGDLIGETSAPGVTSSTEQIKWVSSWLELLQKPTMVCSGNHDVDDDLVDDELLLDLLSASADQTIKDCQSGDSDLWLALISNPQVFTDQAIHTIAGLTFGCAPYYGAVLTDFSKCDILLHHDPPDKTKTCVSGGDAFGSIDLHYALQNGIISPDFVLCGHVHQPLAQEDKIKNSIIINPGASFCGSAPNHRYISI